MKTPMTPAGIEPAILRFVTLCLNHCATAVPRVYSVLNLFYPLNSYREPIRPQNFFVQNESRNFESTYAYGVGYFRLHNAFL